MYEINTEKEIKFTCGCHVLWDSNYIILKLLFTMSDEINKAIFLSQIHPR